MAKKKKLTKTERKEAGLRKGKQWLLTYTGSPKKMNKHYRERFHVDAVTAAKDLQELGVNYTQERLAELYKDCDGRFAFIAGIFRFGFHVIEHELMNLWMDSDRLPRTGWDAGRCETGNVLCLAG